MSALARRPEIVREQHARDLDLMIAGAHGELHDIRRQAAYFQRRVELLLHPRRGRIFWRVLAGIVSLPVLAIASFCLIALVFMLVGW
jgi:hypothetical protein